MSRARSDFSLTEGRTQTEAGDDNSNTFKINNSEKGSIFS